MSTNRTGRVLVATSGSRACGAAITFAADTASARGLALELVHVVTPTVTVGPTGVAPDIAVRQAGREVLARGEALLKSTDNVDQLLAAAFSVASQTGAALRIVHAWSC